MCPHVFPWARLTVATWQNPATCHGEGSSGVATLRKVWFPTDAAGGAERLDGGGVWGCLDLQMGLRSTETVGVRMGVGAQRSRWESNRIPRPGLPGARPS